MTDDTESHEAHETRGTFVISGMLLFGFALVWILVYINLLGR